MAAVVDIAPDNFLLSSEISVPMSEELNNFASFVGSTHVSINEVIQITDTVKDYENMDVDTSLASETKEIKEVAKPLGWLSRIGTLSQIKSNSTYVETIKELFGDERYHRISDKSL